MSMRRVHSDTGPFVSPVYDGTDRAGRIRRGRWPPWWRDAAKHMHELAIRDGGWNCHYCGSALAPLVGEYAADDDHRLMATRDHVIPRARNGRTIVGNMVLCCQPCNGRKGKK